MEFLLLDAHARAQEYSVRNLHPDHGAYRTPYTAILLFQVLLYLSDYYEREPAARTSLGGIGFIDFFNTFLLRSRIYT